MYTSTYNTTETNEKIKSFNRAQMVRGWFVEAYPHKFTRAEKKHLAWCAKWSFVAFIVASIATYFMNRL